MRLSAKRYPNSESMTISPPPPHHSNSTRNGYLTLATSTEANRAIADLNGKFCFDRNVTVQLHRSQSAQGTPDASIMAHNDTPSVKAALDPLPAGERKVKVKQKQRTHSHNDSSAHTNTTKIKEESVSSDSKDDLVVVKERKVSKSGRASGGGDGGIRVKTNDNSDKDGTGGVIVVEEERHGGRSAKKKRKKADVTPSEKRENKRKREDAAVEWDYSGIKAARQEPAHQLRSGDIFPTIREVSQQAGSKELRTQVEKEPSMKETRSGERVSKRQGTMESFRFRYKSEKAVRKLYMEKLKAGDLDYGPLPEPSSPVMNIPYIEQQRRFAMKADRPEIWKAGAAEIAKRQRKEFRRLLDLTVENEAAIKASEETLKETPLQLVRLIRILGLFGQRSICSSWAKPSAPSWRLSNCMTWVESLHTFNTQLIFNSMIVLAPWHRSSVSCTWRFA
jgi:hypothetical protein